jgi:hypothetical protein
MDDDVPDTQLFRKQHGVVMTGIVNQDNVIDDIHRQIVVSLGDRLLGVVSRHDDNDFFTVNNFKLPPASAEEY